MLTTIVQRAMRETVINIGQLSPDDLKTLEAYVEKGYLSKGQGGPYPALKTVYAHPGYDFAGARAAAIAQLQAECQALGETITIPFE